MLSQELTAKSPILRGKRPRITEAMVYAGFNTVSRTALTAWKDTIVKLGDTETTQAAFAHINERLLTSSAIIFFDHHYAFDALPVGLTLARHLKNVTSAVVPYAVHLDMGVDPDGNPSTRYKIRTRSFHWLVNNIQRKNSNIHILPVSREFELSNPRLKAIVDEHHSGINTKYLKLLTQIFARQPVGATAVLSPTAGIALPGKPILHPGIYRTMNIVQNRQEEPLAFYIVSAYPSLHAYHNYLAPLLSNHTFVAHGPFSLPKNNYEEALQIITDQTNALRASANFSMPDYSRIEHK
jgi:hypothetical protein